MNSNQPLAFRMRPKTLDEYVGQEHVLAKDKILYSEKNINLKILSEQNVIVPPIELQNQFADFVNKVDKLKFEMEKSLKELEDNFNSLMQRAFKGELFN